MTAFMDAVADLTADVPRLYPQGEVPDRPDYSYGVYVVTLGASLAYTLDITHGMRRGRVVLQTFGRTADGPVSLAERVVGHLLDRALPVDGWATTPLAIQLDPTIVRLSDPENTGVIDVTTVLSFTATKEHP